MAKMSARVAGLIILFLACNCVALWQQQTHTSTSPHRGGAAKKSGKTTMSPSTGGSSLSISFESSVDLLLTDPQGRRLGDDPAASAHYDEIPKAYYEAGGLEDAETGQAEESAAKILYVADPVAGEYRLKVTGARNGRYSCRFVGNDIQGTQSHFKLSGVPVTAGEIQKFIVSFPETPGREIRVFGGFAPTEASLLTYATPATPNLETPPTARSLPMLVFYDQRILPSSFSSSVNGRQLTTLFHPRAGGWDLVQIPLEHGINRILLSVRGNGGNNAPASNDTFVVTVP